MQVWVSISSVFRFVVGLVLAGVVAGVLLSNGGIGDDGAEPPVIRGEVTIGADTRDH